VVTNPITSSTSSVDESSGAGDDSWLAVSISGITSTSAVYYINLRDPQQQVKVGVEHMAKGPVLSPLSLSDPSRMAASVNPRITATPLVHGWSHHNLVLSPRFIPSLHVVPGAHP
jgi:hypothetical protein